MTEAIDINEYVRAGRITAQRHPTLPLTVCKYTRQFQQTGEWTDVMLGMRGAVYDDDGHKVNAPLRKFFNAGERLAEDEPAGPFWMQEKLDGTCIVAFMWEGEPIVHTLGAFTSPQAKRAQEIVTDWSWMTDYTTYVFELMDPTNFTTLRYTGEPKLVLLAAIDRERDGRSVENPVDGTFEWRGERVKSIRVTDQTFDDIRAIVRDDEEGYVLLSSDHGPHGQYGRLKIKGERFLALHRAVWGLSEKVVWEYLYERTEAERALFRATLDEEPRMWFDEVAARMEHQVAAMEAEAERLFIDATASAETIPEKAAQIKTLDPIYQPYCFMRMNGRAPRRDTFVKAVKPQGVVRYAGIEEEAA